MLFNKQIQLLKAACLSLIKLIFSSPRAVEHIIALFGFLIERDSAIRVGVNYLISKNITTPLLSQRVLQEQILEAGQLTRIIIAYAAPPGIIDV